MIAWLLALIGLLFGLLVASIVYRRRPAPPAALIVGVVTAPATGAPVLEVVEVFAEGEPVRVTEITLELPATPAGELVGAAA